MEFTTKQIQYIDKVLEKGGIKYWDLRIEMIDHVLSSIEEHKTEGNFETQVNAAIERIGWKNNLTKINKQGWQDVNRIYRRKYFIEILTFFTSLRTLLPFVIFCVGYYMLSQYISAKLFIRLSNMFFLAPLLFFIFLSIQTWRKAYGRSVNLDYGFLYLFSGFLVLNMFTSLLDDATMNVQKTIWLFIIPAYVVASVSGYKVFKEAFKRVQMMNKETV